jgi:rhodanese-related sulfurtransferase
VELSLVQFIQKDHNFLLLATAVVSGGMLLWPLVRRSTGGPWVSVAQATQLINRDDALVIDVRDPGEYQAGHILGAKNTPLERIAGTEIKRKDKPVILYCDTGDRATKAAAILKKQGIEKAVCLTGGLGAWKSAGMPVEK